ncbi:MAG: copper amine oxidase N-terminal domain-containing protein [Clostridiales bacterium]|nr:copper amine oxidase N-terminal domain-containing protein [Clostridiales bacterium]
MTKKSNFSAKKVIAGLVAAGVLASGSAVFAEYNPDKTADPSLDYTTLSADSDVHAVTAEEIPQDIAPAVEYNGASILAGVEEADGHKMFPVRYVFENLGYEVTWVEDSEKIQLNRGAVEIGMYIGQDSYYFAKTMPAPLGAAPTLIDGETTYAPVELLTEIAKVKVIDNNDGTILVVDPAEVSFQGMDIDDRNNTRLTVNDIRMGEVIVYVTEDTEITVNGEKGSIEDLNSLESGQTFKIGYSPVMTMSLPPQTTALTIDILSL